MADHATTVVELVHAARRGDTTAFGELVDRFRDMVYGLAYHLTGDFEDAVDLAQDAFVRAYERLPQLRDATRFPGWLRQIVTNLHRTSARRSRPSVEPPRQHDSAPGEIQLAVREALQGLREPDRLVLTLHYINGYSQAEIGDFLDTSADVVKTRLARARARLRSGVTEMMEDTLSQQRLPSSFRGGVVAGVAALVRDLRKVVPSDLDDVVERLGLRRNAMWREVMATRPDADQPLVPQSDAQARPLSGYPDDAQQTALQAIEITALQHTLACLSPPSWVADLDCLWVWLKPDTVEGRTSAWLSRVPGKTWRVCMFQFDRPAPAPTGPPSRHARHRDVGQLLRSLADDLTEVGRAAADVRAALGAALPADAEDLATELRAQMAERFLAAMGGLTAEQRERMAGEESVSATELSPEVREELRQAVALHWALGICGALSGPHAWSADAPSARLEFGLYPPDTGDVSGREYVKIRSSDGQNSFQTCIEG